MYRKYSRTFIGGLVAEDETAGPLTDLESGLVMVELEFRKLWPSPQYIFPPNIFIFFFGQRDASNISVQSHFVKLNMSY